MIENSNLRNRDKSAGIPVINQIVQLLEAKSQDPTKQFVHGLAIICNACAGAVSRSNARKIVLVL